MRLLVLGGTIFLGRHVVERALALGHEVTIFHRGNHGADLFPKVESAIAVYTSELDHSATGAGPEVAAPGPPQLPL